MSMKSVFSFASVGHFFASLVHDIDTGAKWLAKETPGIEAGVDTAASIASTVSPTVAGIASTIDRAGKSLLGDALALATSTDSAAQVGGLSVPLDAATVASLKQLAADIHSVSKTSVPAGLPVTAPAAS